MTFEHNKTNDILKLFEQLSQIPRCSGNEKAIRNWKVPASSGYENSPIVVLQGHLDMVCEKTPDSNHDFSKDPIKFIYDGEWLTADKTTLGADNGIGVAIAMALALDKELSHPPLELLFTVEEETGLVGASALEPAFIDGKILINLDGGGEGNFIIGCAGGLNSYISVPVEWAEVPSPYYQLMKIKAGGMKTVFYNTASRYSVNSHQWWYGPQCDSSGF